MVDGEETRGEKEVVEEQQERREEDVKEDKGKEVANVDDDDDDEEDFNAFQEEEDDDDDDDDDDEVDVPQGEVEVDDLNEPGTSAEKAKRKRNDDDEEAAEIVAGLSGDEVDPTNIIEGGRGARRGRYTGGAGGSGAKKYTAKAEVASDEDSW